MSDGTADKKRRGLLNVLLGAGGLAWLGAFLYPVIRFFTPPEQLESEQTSVLVGKEEEFQPGTAQLFKFGRKPGMLLRTADGEFRAFIAICTHLDCTVQYVAEKQIIWCACHNGQYDLTGKTLAGPPPRPLDTLRVQIRSGEVHVSKEA